MYFIMKIKQKLKSLWRRELFLLAIAMSIIFVGADLSTHLHNSWLFHEFMTEGGLHLFDPYTSGGNQFVYGYGTIAYSMTGFFYHFVGPFTVDFIEITAFLIMAMLSYYLVKDWKIRAFWFVLALGLVSADTMPHFISMFLFVLGVYFSEKNKEKLSQSFMIMACLNHPFMAMICLLMVSKEKKLFSTSVILIFILQMTVLRTGFYQTSHESMIFTQAFISIFRSFIILFPFLIIPKKTTMRFYNLFNWMTMKRDLVSPVSKIIMYFLIFYLVFFIPSISIVSGIQSFIIEDKFSDFPVLEGTIRVVDDIYFEPVVHLPKKGMVLSNSQYFEGRNTVFSGDICGYVDYLSEKNISYVFIKEGAIFSLNEERMLKTHFENIFNKEGYIIFDVKSASDTDLEGKECYGESKVASEYKDVITWSLNVAISNLDNMNDRVEEFSYFLNQFQENISQNLPFLTF